MYSDADKKTMRCLAETCPAMGEFAHSVKNHLVVIIGNLFLIEKAESPTQAETYRARAKDAADKATQMFREVGL